MTSKERVLLAFTHQEPDRVPLDLSATEKANRRLCAELGITSPQNPYDLWHEDLMQRLHVDFRWPWPPYCGPALKRFPDGSFISEWGIRRAGHGGGYAIDHPLCARTVEEIEQYPLPSPDWYDYSGLAHYAEENRDYAIMGGGWSPVFGIACDLLGMEDMLCRMAVEPPPVIRLLARIADFYVAFSERCFEAMRGKVDIFFMGDDFGSERDLLMSPQMWRSFCKPYLLRLVDLARSYGISFCMLHSCGSVIKIIPDILEAGFDALDPIQPEAMGMDAAEIKLRYGARLVQHGTVSLRTLSTGRVEDVVREVRARLETLMKGGGVALGPTNWLLEETPTRNILAFYDTASEFGRYR